jgi:hypothetical protein
MTEKGPDRIWVRISDGRFSWLMSTHEITGATEYVRADLAGWQKIKTVPPDKTNRIIMSVGRKRAKVFVVGEGYFDDIIDAWVWSIDHQTNPVPTHWCPLPAPPENEP